MLNPVTERVAKQRNISFVSLLVLVLLLGYTVPLGAAPKLDKIKKNKIKVKKNKLNKSALQVDETEPSPPPPCLPNTERGRKGQWCESYDISNSQVVPVHMSVLPNGKVIYWGGNLGGVSNNQTRYQIWDPAVQTPSTTPTPPTTYLLDSKFGNIYCSGHSFLPDGHLLVTGGNALPSDNGTTNFKGIDNAALFDFASGQWTQVFGMNDRRWYPTNLTLGNGNTLVWSGVTETPYVNRTPQILEKQFNGNFSWQSLKSLSRDKYDIHYSWTHLLSSGKVFIAVGYESKSYFLSVGDRFRYLRDYMHDGPALNYPHDAGASVVFDRDKILIVGGADFPKRDAEFLDLTGATPIMTKVGLLEIGRRHLNATLLPDGKVLATGGNKGYGFNNNCVEHFVKTAEMWGPDEPDKWKQLASATQPRLYHSTAVLLPDGRVLSGGTSKYSDEQTEASPCPLHTDNYKMEIFSPPYLFNLDGTDAVRPQISNAPSQVAYGQTIQFTVTDAGMGSKVNLIRLPSVTHSFNQNQGVNKLTPTINGQNFSVTIPANRNECPPGHYMMFVINIAGVPSKAKIIQVL